MTSVHKLVQVNKIKVILEEWDQNYFLHEYGKTGEIRTCVWERERMCLPKGDGEKRKMNQSGKITLQFSCWLGWGSVDDDKTDEWGKKGQSSSYVNENVPDSTDERELYKS